MISKGLAKRLRQTAVLLVAFGGSWMAPSAHSAITDQLLDQVEVASANKVLRLNESPTEVLGLAAVRQTRFRTCQSSNINGLFCLDGQTVRFWSTVTEHALTAASPPAEAGTALFSCLDTALGLDSNGCSAMTADVNGDIWIAGQKQSGTTSSLFRVTAKVSGACPAGNYFTDSSVAYCQDEVRTGRVGGIRDLSPVDGELVTGTSPGQFPDKGVLAVENFSTVVFYPRDKNISPVEIGNWGGVQLTSASILQRRSSSDFNTILTYGLVTTTAGNVISRKLPSGALAAISVNGTLGPLARGTACVPQPSNNPNTFRIRGSETSGRIIATNRDYCRLLLWTPLYDSDEIVGVNTSYPVINLLTGTAGGTTYPPDNLSVSAGNSVNTADPKCTMQSGPGATGGCPLIGDGGDTNAYPAVRMYGVTVEGPATGLFVFKIDAIPDCRYPEIKALYASDPNHPCNKLGTVVTPSGLTNPKPQQQYLNVTPLLPTSVTDLFNDSETKPLGLPPLYISPQYRAQKAEGYFFQAIFGVADPNIQFRKTFTVEFDIGDPNLAGASLGCGVQSTVGDPPLPSPKPFNELDIVTMVSERFSSVGGPTGLVLDSGTAKAEHVDQLINKGCYNPTPSAGTRWSMYAYNLALAEDKPPTTPSGSFTYSPAIAYLSNLVLALHTQLGDAQKKLACTNVDAVGNDPFDPNAAPPLTQATCNTLNTQWANAQDKLKKCAAAAQNPKNSAPNQNCNSFVSQFNTYKAMVEALTPSGQDPANRVGELWSRTDVIKYMYSHFLKAAQIGATAANSTSTP